MSSTETEASEYQSALVDALATAQALISAQADKLIDTERALDRATTAVTTHLASSEASEGESVKQDKELSSSGQEEMSYTAVKHSTGKRIPGIVSDSVDTVPDDKLVGETANGISTIYRLMEQTTAEDESGEEQRAEFLKLLKGLEKTARLAELRERSLVRDLGHQIKWRNQFEEAYKSGMLAFRELDNALAVLEQGQTKVNVKLIRTTDEYQNLAGLLKEE